LSETEKITMKESQIDALVQEKAEKAVAALMEKQNLEQKLDTLIKEQGNTYVQDQFKEQMQDILKAQKVEDPELKAAEEAAKGFKSMGDFLLSVRNFRMNRKLDDRLTFISDNGRYQKTAGHMEIGDDSQGGFLVPEVYRPELKIIALENAVVRPNGATVFPPVASDSLKIPTIVDTSHASSVFGGVVAYWTAEQGVKQATKPAFGQVELTPKKLAGLTYTSNELLMDSAIALEPLIKRMFGTAWGYYEDDAFLNGTGTGQPMGIQNCGALKTCFRNTVNRVFFEDLREMYACMLPSSHPYAVWVLNPSVLPDLIGMTSGDAAPAAASNPIWLNRNMGATSPIPGTIFGRPFFISEKMPALGTQGDIGYFDMRYYLIFDRQPLTIDASTHVAFTTDETCWRFVLRVDGQCWPQSTITPRYAAAPVTTISPFVVLAATTS
jgi:HK97 family phage major capsid protein